MRVCIVLKIGEGARLAFPKAWGPFCPFHASPGCVFSTFLILAGPPYPWLVQFQLDTLCGDTACPLPSLGRRADGILLGVQPRCQAAYLLFTGGPVWLLGLWVSGSCRVPDQPALNLGLLGGLLFSPGFFSWGGPGSRVRPVSHTYC